MYSSDDDSRMLSSVQFGDALSAFEVHVALKLLFYEKERTQTELAGLKECTIVLSDCHIE